MCVLQFKVLKNVLKIQHKYESKKKYYILI